MTTSLSVSCFVQKVNYTMDPVNCKTDRKSDILDAVLSLEYEAQHFGFHPRNFLDLVYNAFFENVSSSLTEMKQYMIQEFKEIRPPNVIKAQTDKFLQELVKECDKSIDKLEVYLVTNVFSFGTHIVLPEDEVHIKNPCTNEDDERLDAEIEELKQKIFEEKAKRFSLKKKVSEQKGVKEMLLALQSELKYLLSVAYQEGVTPENIESLYAELRKLSDMNIHPI